MNRDTSARDLFMRVALRGDSPLTQTQKEIEIGSTHPVFFAP